jgi:hypothetical protein
MITRAFDPSIHGTAINSNKLFFGFVGMESIDLFRYNNFGYHPIEELLFGLETEMVFNAITVHITNGVD